MAQHEYYEKDSSVMCIVCGTRIPPTSDRCGKCGWTWTKGGEIQIYRLPEKQERIDWPETPSPSPKKTVKSPLNQARQKFSVRSSDHRNHEIKAEGPNQVALIIGLIICAIVAWIFFR